MEEPTGANPCPEERAQPSAQTSAASSERRKVLIADDEQRYRSTLAMLLRMESWEVVEAEDGKQAVEAAVKESPHVVILDHRMPELVGTDAYQHMRQLNLTMPVVLVTAAQDAEHLAQSVGIRHVLKKPFEFEQLQRILEDALGGMGG